MSQAGQGDPLAPDLAAASAALRDTAKWIVGGVVGTSAAVFAGSSLTNLGSLTLPADTNRILVVVAGALIGFLAIGGLARRALSVLTIRGLSFGQLVAARTPDMRQVVQDIDTRYASEFPGGVRTLRDFKARIEAENGKEAGRQDEAFLAEADSFLPVLMAEASFLHVCSEFARLKRALFVSAFGAILGFGAFAWGANPPPAAPHPPFLVINRI